jgi:hypothetical protein
MEFLKKFWNWILSQITVDDKVITKISEVKKEVAEAKVAINEVIKESKDVVTTVKPKKKRNYYKPKGSGVTVQPKGSGVTVQPKGSGVTVQPKGSGVTVQPKKK